MISSSFSSRGRREYRAAIGSPRTRSSKFRQLQVPDLNLRAVHVPCLIHLIASLFLIFNSLFDRRNYLFRDAGNLAKFAFIVRPLSGASVVDLGPNRQNSLFFPCLTGNWPQRPVRRRLLPPPALGLPTFSAPRSPPPERDGIGEGAAHDGRRLRGRKRCRGIGWTQELPRGAAVVRITMRSNKAEP